MIYNLASSKDSISKLIIDKILSTKTFVLLCNKFQIDPSRIKKLKLEFKDLEDNYAETDGSKMVLNKSMFNEGIEVFFKKYFFIIMHEIVHFLSRSKERDGYFNDPEEVLGFVSAIAYELENNTDLDEIWNKIYPKVNWHFKNEEDSKKFFEEMLLKAKEFGSVHKQANVALNTLNWGASQIGDFYNRARSVSQGGLGAAVDQIGQNISGYIRNKQQIDQRNKANQRALDSEREIKQIDLILFYVHNGKYNLNNGINELNKMISYAPEKNKTRQNICSRITMFLSKYQSQNVMALSKPMYCSGPGQAKCFICGKYVNGSDRFCDTNNISKKGQNSTFCTQHANELGITTRC